jgi:hypothetical protein
VCVCIVYVCMHACMYVCIRYTAVFATDRLITLKFIEHPISCSISINSNDKFYIKNWMIYTQKPENLKYANARTLPRSRKLISESYVNTICKVNKQTCMVTSGKQQILTGTYFLLGILGFLQTHLVTFKMEETVHRIH